jgi:CDP-4-dehydro-6-deoxyglucose reductase
MIVNINGINSFGLMNQESMLSGALRAGINFPYSCKNGRCSACKCKVVNGSTQLIFPEIGLSEAEKAEGWILGCARTAITNIEVKVLNLVDVVLPPVLTLPCRINGLDFLASDIMRVVLRLPPSANFEFIPGQYIQVISPNGVKRSYSVAGYDRSKLLIELHVRAVEGGVASAYWFGNAKVNDLLRLIGPMGTFFIRNYNNLDIYFLATGTGIAPIKSIIESMANVDVDGVPRSITVIWGGRKESDIYLSDEIFKKSYPVKFIPVLSRAESGWKGSVGYVQNVLLDLKPNLSCSAVYACGSSKMIESSRSKLVEAGLAYDFFYSDAFVASDN